MTGANGIRVGYRVMILDTYAAGAQDSIVLPTPLPQLLRPRMSNTASGDDDLGLEERLRSALRDRYEPGVRVGAEKGSAVFVDADQLSRALRPVVQYTVTGRAYEPRCGCAGTVRM